MRKILIFICIASLFLITACAQNAPTTPTQPAPQAQPTQVEPVPTTHADALMVNDDVTKLMQKADSVKSYSFSIVKLPDTHATNTYYVKGNLIKVVPIDSQAPKDISVIYLDTSAKTATGYCTYRGCAKLNMPVSLNYNDWIVPLPTEWMDQAKYGKTAGSFTFLNRPVTKVRYEANGKYYEAYIDNYYGFPLHVAIADDESMTTVTGGYEYRSIAYNSVKDSDVTFTPVNV